MPSLALACRLSAVSRASRRPFSPASLFSSGEQGVWYDPSDFSTLFQDAAGTIPVTAVEQPVGKMLDKSGRGNHATQATVTKRPILKIDGNGKYYLLFDGVDDAMQTGNIDFTSTDKMTVWAGVRKLGIGSQVCVELGTNANDVNGSFGFFAPGNFASSDYMFVSRGTKTRPAAALGYSTPSTNTITASASISGDLVSLRVNAIQSARDVLDQGIGNFGNYPLYIGSRGGTTLPFKGHLYSLIIRGAQSSEAQILSAEAYCNQKTGAY